MLLMAETFCQLKLNMSMLGGAWEVAIELFTELLLADLFAASKVV